MSNLPPIPDWAMALFFMAALVGVGMLLGSILKDIHHPTHTGDLARRMELLELRLETLASKVLRLEHRFATEQPPPPVKE